MSYAADFVPCAMKIPVANKVGETRKPLPFIDPCRFQVACIVEACGSHWVARREASRQNTINVLFSSFFAFCTKATRINTVLVSN